MPDFTLAQRHAIGDLMAEHWSANMQTGFDAGRIPYVYVQLGPNLPVEGWSIWPDGTITYIDDTLPEEVA